MNGFLGVVYFLIGIFAILMGIFAIKDPEEFLYLRFFARFRNFDPTERYIRMTRISGYFYILVGIACIVYPFIK